MDEKIVGIRLKELRKAVGVSQARFAIELGGVSQAVIARYGTGDIFPSYPILIKIADYFNVSTDYLLGRTDNPAGKIYEQTETKEGKIDDFIEMCFDPSTNAHAKLKETLKKMLEEQQK